MPGIRRLAVDYTSRFAELAPFYAGDPLASGAWQDAIGRTQRHRRDRAGLVSLLAAQQDRRGAPPAARAAVQRLAGDTTVAVITGQQAGLFGGPLYTLLKALTTIRLAQDVSSIHGTPAVPVFWIDSEDHDWDEVASTTVLDGESHPHVISLPRPLTAGEVPVATVVLSEDVTAAIGTLRAALAETEFSADLIDGLSRAYRPGVGMSDAFGRWLEHVLGPHGLIVFDCADPAAKPLVAGVFAHELSHPGTTAALAAKAGDALAARGYHAQVEPHDGVALFHLAEGRQAIKLVDGRFIIGARACEPSALLAEASTHPERFSPNVLLRPLVQDALFPTVCYVAGPSELAYLGQLREVYAHFGVPMPLIYPRQTATVLDSAATRFLTRYGVALEALQAQDEAELNHLLEAQLPPGVEASLHDASRAVEERMAAVIAAVPALDPTLEGAARSTLGRMTHDLRALHSKVIHAAKRRDETLRRQFHRAQVQAFPQGHLQERTLGFVYFLNRYGPVLVDILRRDIPLAPGAHWVVTP